VLGERRALLSGRRAVVAVVAVALQQSEWK